MERFTERDEFGNAGINGVDSMDLQCNLEFDEFNRVTDALNRLADYEDLEEQGKLLELPCAVGDTAWIVFEGEIFECMVLKFDIVRNGIFPMLRINETLETISVSMKTLEKTWFLTREEAESALEAERKGGDA